MLTFIYLFIFRFIFFFFFLIFDFWPWPWNWKSYVPLIILVIFVSVLCNPALPSSAVSCSFIFYLFIYLFLITEFGKVLCCLQSTDSSVCLSHPDLVTLPSTSIIRDTPLRLALNSIDRKQFHPHHGGPFRTPYPFNRISVWLGPCAYAAN